jgi:SAM-dependent methyltransferase
MLAPGRRGLGFGVGRELLPSVLAAHGVQTTATDLPAEDERSEVWSGTGQHASGIDRMFDRRIVEWDAYCSLCEYRPVDMNRIPAELHGGYDFCWSVCALEHLGSIEQGLNFIEQSVRCLRPGGVAVHTTEYNLQEDGPTVDNWPTVLFQRRHMEVLGQRLATRGARLLAIDFSTGEGVLDGFVDLPPYAHSAPGWLRYPHAPHLRLSFGGFPVTSIGLVIRAEEPPKDGQGSGPEATRAAAGPADPRP